MSYYLAQYSYGYSREQILEFVLQTIGSADDDYISNVDYGIELAKTNNVFQKRSLPYSIPQAWQES